MMKKGAELTATTNFIPFLFNLSFLSIPPCINAIIYILNTPTPENIENE
jgi:hypothetical protein